MERRLIPTLFIVSIVCSSAQSQEINYRSPFISANLGVFVSSLKDFDRVYDSNLGIAFGAGIGLPLSSRTYIYGKATYFVKTGVPVLYTYTYQNGTLVNVSQTKTDGTASFHQWIINGGLQYNFFLSENFALGLNGGLTYTKISETMTSVNTTVTSTLDASGLLGFFAGMGLERSFSESPFSVFAEAQYNFVQHDILAAAGNYGGANLTLGLRYYFREHRRQ